MGLQEASVTFGSGFEESFEPDEFYESFQAPKFHDFTAPEEPIDPDEFFMAQPGMVLKKAVVVEDAKTVAPKILKVNWSLHRTSPRQLKGVRSCKHLLRLLTLQRRQSGLPKILALSCYLLLCQTLKCSAAYLRFVHVGLLGCSESFRAESLTLFIICTIVC
ncbi:hypothetical protein KC19_5G077300 [Ceratodon purpureus]|uniref:Uncharacterized protein n=1 Tax=Ceratodon purpureus TaxID=3225 RepID=A0A8T0I038_CERPU|nr:hypothetical protein KC19_5G077300 [Ceratodon purpureus]